MKSRKWSKADTRKFYKLLAIFGANFDLISNNIFFPLRSRKEIKSKFRREDMKNKAKID